MDSPQWLIEAKARPSVSLAGLVPRGDLRQFIDRDEFRLALVHAPAGYGKTSAMAQWYEHAVRYGKRTAWVSLDDQDADPFQFLCYVAAACRMAGCEIDYELPPHPQALAPSTPDQVSTAVLNALNNGTKPDLIFLDDFQYAENSATSLILRRMMGELPMTKIILSARSIPRDINLAELRANGHVFEVSMAELQFSADDVERYLGTLISGTERAAYCENLAVRTEGWPIALKAIRQLIKSGKSADDAIKRASGRDSVLSDYFIEQVFNSLPDEHQALLLNTAILDRVNGDLADAICGTNAAWMLLDDLEKNDVFVQSLDPERQWYRYHRLFAEFIAERARRTVAVEIERNAAQAAIWFRENGFPTEALHYAMQSKEPELVAETLDEIGGWRHAVLCDLQGVDQALKTLPRQTLEVYPRAWLAGVYIKLKGGELEAAQAEFQNFRGRYRELEANDSLLADEIAIFDSLIFVYQDHQAGVERNIHRLQDMVVSAPRDDHFLHAARLNLLCGLHARTCDFDKAIATGEAAIYHYRQVGSLYGEVFIYFHQAFILYRQGRLRDAWKTLEQGLDLTTSHFGGASELYAIGAAFAALFVYERNDRASAQKYLDSALPVIEQCDAWAEVFVAAYGAAFSLAASKHNWDEVDLIRRRALKAGEMRRLPRIVEFINACFDDIMMRNQRADAECGAPDKAPECALSDLSGVHVICAYGRKLIRSGRNRDAISFLTEQSSAARDTQMIRAFMTLSLLTAFAHQADGDINGASDHFEDVLSFAIFEDYKRPIIDEGRAVVDLVADIETLARQQRNNRLRDKFLAEILVEINADQNPETGDKELLSPREKDVLRNLIRGRSNREISEEMGVSLNTVKFHLKNVFQKLGVSTREAAVRMSLRDRIL